MGFLTGKTAIITGAGRAVLKDGSCGSIGYGIATAYAKEGANLVITGRNIKKLEAAKQELESLYGIKVLTALASSATSASRPMSAAPGGIRGVCPASPPPRARGRHQRQRGLPAGMDGQARAVQGRLP